MKFIDEKKKQKKDEKGPKRNKNVKRKKKCVAYPQDDFLFTILHWES
jgi:hypothetical protein